MSVLHPLILAAGLGALSIPVLVHFLRRRRRPIPWAAMRFLQEAVRKRRRRLRLEQILLFLTRCALVALLALAVARPILGGLPGSARPTVLVLAMDDAIASALRDADGRSSLERAVERARRALDGLGPGDRVGLVTLGAPGAPLVWPPTGDPDAVRRALDRLEPTDGARTLNALRVALDDEPAGEDRLVVRLLSDWRGADPAALFAGRPLPGVAAVAADPPAPGRRLNQGVRSALATNPLVLEGGAALAPPPRLIVTLGREGDEEAEERLTEIEVIARPGGAIAGTAQARFAPGQTTAQAVVALDDAAFEPGRGGRVALEVRIPPDANPRDDAARVVLTVRRELRVGVVERAPPPGSEGVAPGVWARAALTPDARAGIDAFRVDPAALASLPPASVDAIVVLGPGRLGRDAWTRAAELLARGGLVVLAPDPDAARVDWNDSLATLTEGRITAAPSGPVGAATRLDARVSEGLLAGLAGEFGELARSVAVRRLLPLTLADDAVALLRTENGASFLAQSPGPGGRGTVAVFAAAIDTAWSDLPARPVFVPVMQELVRRGSGLGVDGRAVAGIALPEHAGVDRWTHDAALTGAPASVGQTGARAGVLLGLGPDGAVLRTHTVNPDAGAAGTEPADAEALRAAIADAFPGADLDFGDGASGGAATPGVRRSTPAGDRLALLLLSAAACLAVFEAVIARAASHPEGGAR